MPKPIYLDYNATTPHDPEVIAAMRPYLEEEFGNPSSSHFYGKAPQKAVADARGQVAKLIGCRPEEIVFTSGGTESNNHALIGVAEAYGNKGNHIITSQIEHPAILAVCNYLEQKGMDVTYVPVDEKGMVSVSAVERAITAGTILITIMHANNEVGTIQPLADIAGIAKAGGILLHTDAAQSVGKIPTRVDELGVDLLSVAGHKIYAPKGVGALFMRSGIRLPSFMHGAGQESGRRAGTENVLEIVGLVDPETVPRHRVVMVGVKLTTMDLVKKGEEFSRVRGVVSVSVVTGRFDLILMVLLKEGFGLLEFYTEEVSRLEGVQSVETFVVYKSYNLKVPYIF
jgi:cysteine desulfurase